MVYLRNKVLITYTPLLRGMYPLLKNSVDPDQLSSQAVQVHVSRRVSDAPISVSYFFLLTVCVLV